MQMDDVVADLDDTLRWLAARRAWYAARKLNLLLAPFDELLFAVRRELELRAVFNDVASPDHSDQIGTGRGHHVVSRRW